ncbi:MAG: exonuclease SbcCD subunit D [Cellulosilyticaceae bacterium]
MKILHTSDWHLGRNLHGYSLIEDQEYVLKELLAYIKQEQIDFLIIAGDVYDKSQPSDEAIKLFNEFLTEVISKQNIPTVIISGNHDSGTKIHFGSTVFETQGLYIVGQSESGYKRIVLEKDTERVDVYMIPYMTPGIVRDIAGDESIKTHEEAMSYIVSEIKKEKEEYPSILVAHAFVAGGDISDSEKNLCAVGTAELVNAGHFKAFTYTALGHLHKPQKISEEFIRYSGSLLKYSTSEANHKKGVTIIEIKNNKLVGIEEVALETKRDLRILTGTVEEIIEQATKENDKQKDDYVFAKLIGQPVADVMNILKKVYPRALGVEFISEKEAKKSQEQELQELELQKGKSITELFMEFIDFVGDTSFEEDERTYIEEVIKSLEEESYEA